MTKLKMVNKCLYCQLIVRSIGCQKVIRKACCGFVEPRLAFLGSCLVLSFVWSPKILSLSYKSEKTNKCLYLGPGVTEHLAS